jgi:hypothetical protein
MSKFTPNSGLGEYTPEEFTVRFPEKPDVNAHWSDVWPKSFKSSIAELLGEHDEASLAADLSLGIEVLRMAEICGASREQDGKIINNITLTRESVPEKLGWVTLSSDAQINRESLVEAAEEIGKSIVVGQMPGKSGNAARFKNAHPNHPALTLSSVDEVISTFDSTKPIAFYYPSVPHAERDINTLRLLSEFPKSIMLYEKPSHNTAEEAKAFKE